jgi:tetratricopeptide (TPR) repeat protein
MRGDVSILSLEEMLYSATLTNDLNEKLKFYQTAATAFPTCIRAQNNVGYTYMAMYKAGIVPEAAAPAAGGGGRGATGSVALAIAAFERARAIENNDVVKNNLGMASLARGEIVKAEEYFTSMSSAIPESRWGLGVIAITKGQYDQAVNYFGSDASLNNALALILKGDYTRAKSMLDGLQVATEGSTVTRVWMNEGNPNFVTATVPKGKRDYLKAVVGARLDDRAYMLNGLRAAIAADAEWKDFAKTDLEFAKYFNDNDFRSAVQ